MKKFLLISFLVLLFVEFVLRVLGYKPQEFKNQNSKLRSEPKPLFQIDDKYGYKYLPGNKKVTLNNALTYSISINQDGTRHNPFLKNVESSIAIFGCSFFAGMGVGDSSTVGAQLQLLIKNYQVNNYSIPGHGMTTQYLMLEELIQKDEKPDIAVFEIASFHLIRNLGGYDFIKNFSKIKDAPVKYVVANFNDDNVINFRVIDVNKEFSVFSKYSSFYNIIYSKFKSLKHPKKLQLQLQLKLIENTLKLCDSNSITPVFVVITNDIITDKIQDFMVQKKIPFVKSLVNHHNADFNLSPYDEHPNEKAHKQYADEIYEYICKHESCH